MEKISLRLNHLFYISLCFIVWYALSGIFAYPAVDDYTYAYRAIERGFWNNWIHEYLNWNGRYTATAILSFNPLTWGAFGLYHFIPSMLLTTLLSGTYILFSEIFRGVLSKSEVVKVTSFFVFLFILRHLALGQNLYWMAGSVTYTLPIFFYCIGLTSIFKYFRSTTPNQRANFLVISLTSSAILIGFNETIMVLWDFTVLSLIVYRWFYYKSLDKGLLGLLFFSLVFSFIVLLAPGNSVRSGKYQKSHQVFRTIGNSFTYTLVYTIKFLSPAYLLFLLFNKKLIKSLRMRFQVMEPSKKNLRFIIFVWFGLMFLTMAPSLWGMGRRPNDRTLASSIFFYYLIFPILSYQFYHHYRETLGPMILKIRKVPSQVLTFIFLASLLMYNNSALIYGSLFEFYDYKKFMVERHKEIQGKEGEILYLPAYPYEKRPHLIMFKDIDTHTNSFAEYFKLKKVIITNPEEAKER